MIVRILGEGQYELDEREVAALNVLDADLTAAVEARDEDRFAGELSRLLDAVRWLGRPVPDEQLLRSDLILPGDGARLDEITAWLSDDGLIPG